MEEIREIELANHTEHPTVTCWPGACACCSLTYYRKSRTPFALQSQRVNGFLCGGDGANNSVTCADEDRERMRGAHYCLNVDNIDCLGIT